jgi:hypothetical protein
MEEEIGEEAIELNQNASGNRQPDGGDNRCCREKFVHECLLPEGES